MKQRSADGQLCGMRAKWTSIFWPYVWRSEESKERFQLAFIYEKTNFPALIPNWAWGLAAYSNLIPHETVPHHVPNNYDWPRLQNAWNEGLRGEGTRITVRRVLASPSVRETTSASSHQ